MRTKNVGINIRVDENEKRNLERKAKKSGLSLSAYLRKVGLEKEIYPIPEEDRKLVETIRNYGYGLGNGLTPFEEVMKFAQKHGRLPKRTEESALYQKWLKTDEKKKVDSYVGKKLEEIPEEDRKLVETIRNYGYLGKKSKLSKSRQQYEKAKEKNSQAREFEEQVSQLLKERGQVHEE